MGSEIKIGVVEGDGDPPFLRSVLILNVAFEEAMAVLDECQYAHVKGLVFDLAREQSPGHAVYVDVESIEDYFELKDKGGVLGKINLRVYFGVDESNRAIVILGVDNKKNDHQTKIAIKVRMRMRWRRYRVEGGEYALVAIKRRRSLE